MWMHYIFVVLLTAKSNIAHSSSTDKDMSAQLVSTIEKQLSSAFRELDRLQRMSKLRNEPENYHRVTRVTQSDKGDHYQVDMEYIPDSVKPKVYVSASNGASFRVLNVREYGLVTVDFPKLGRRRWDDTTTLVTFEFPLVGVEFSLELDLNSYKLNTHHDLSNSTHMYVPAVLMSVDLPQTVGDVSSPRAREDPPQVDIVLWTEVGVAPPRWMSVRVGFWVASDEEGDDMANYSFGEIPPVQLKVVHHDERAGYRQWTAVIHSGQGHPYPEGKLVVYPEVYFHCHSRCLVKSFHGSPRSVFVRRTSGDTELRVSQMLAWKSVLGA